MELARQMLAVGVVFGLLAAALWALRRRGLVRARGAARANDGSPLMEVVDRLALSPQHSLHLVRLADRLLVVATHSGGCSVLRDQPVQPFERSAP
jgi:flagellar biosynthetic protein FliO